MKILNDYRCTGCGTIREHWTERPAPSVLFCQECGADSTRLFSAVALARGESVTNAGKVAPRTSLCTRYPMVPGLCHMSEDAGRMWVAKYRGDSRAIEVESERQEVKFKEKPLSVTDAITHTHSNPPSPSAAAVVV